MHVDRMHQQQATYLFELSWKRKYTDRGIKTILAKYAEEAEFFEVCNSVVFDNFPLHGLTDLSAVYTDLLVPLLDVLTELLVAVLVLALFVVLVVLFPLLSSFF